MSQSNTSDYLSSLNGRQLEAVTETEGRVRVVAGAGSGKTRVLAARYAFLVEEVGVDPANILCMTFTNKAAQEIQLRNRYSLRFSSFHNFQHLKFLRSKEGRRFLILCNSIVLKEDGKFTFSRLMA